MFSNSYDPNKYDPKEGFELPPPGNYKARVEEAKPATSQAGREMVKVTFSLDDYSGRIFHNFVESEWLQRYLDQFFDAFGIDPNDFDKPEYWIGTCGEIKVKHETYQDKTYAKIDNFVLKKNQGKKQGTAPAPSGSRAMYSDVDENGVYEDDFPFNTDDFANMDEPPPGAEESCPF